MNQFWKDVRLAGIMGLVIPGILLGIAAILVREEGVSDQEMDILSTQPSEKVRVTEIEIPVLSEGAVTEMELSDYLTGVVLAEMPASFETEALKAQAVVARTYAIRTSEKGIKHESGAVCTASNCCQGYRLEADYLAQGGKKENLEKVRSAVADTANQVLTYEGELIEATYFSCSGGSTEAAVAVWGTDVPYLQAVSSPGEENSAYYTDTVTFTAEELEKLLDLELSGDPQDWITNTVYTAGGSVDVMEIGGISFKGTTLRTLLGLRSTAFTARCDGKSITITTKGYGHRVGMSQYGADAMAASGSSCEEILAHYYQGAILTEWID